MRDGELRCRPRQAAGPSGQGGMASTPTARKSKTKELAICISRDLLNFSLLDVNSTLHHSPSSGRELRTRRDVLDGHDWQPRVRVIVEAVSH